mmetsp:Transcript_23748/g.38108  ORF Transcript_23748/g.38108 Transcript_23748/m.38108 type:complete len:403 (-) Transcript_23748:265-1473(-)
MGATLPHPVTSKALKRAGNENYHVGAAEMHGWRIHMEDAMTIRLKLSEKHRNLSMFGVYDGHRGSKCSKFLEDHLPNVIGNLKDPTSKKELTDALVQFDQKFLKHQDIRLDGSTCVFALCQPLGGAEGAKKGYKVTVCNVGDSRALIVRSNGRMVPLTMDHKPENSVERRRIYMAGGFVKQNRVDGQLALSRAFGDWSYKNNSALSYHEQKVIAVPDVTNEIMYEGDTLLVCCDGLFEQLSREAVAKFVHQSLQKDRRRDPAAIVAELLDEVLHHGSKDNMSCICIRLQDGRQFADRTAQFLPGKFHEYKNEQDFVRAYFADAKKYGVTRQKLMAMLPPPEDEPDEPPNIALASRRNSPIHLIGFVLALGFVLFMMPEHRAIISMLVFIIVVGVLAHFPSII